MDSYLASYLKRYNQRIAQLETHKCLGCQQLIKENAELRGRVEKLELEIAEIYRRNLT